MSTLLYNGSNFIDMTIYNYDNPLISVIVAVYNGSKTLQRCIDSFSQQTYPAKELIIIDGGSTDGTVGLIRENIDKFHYWKSEPDRGTYHAWNKALDCIRGEWVCFLGSDDFFWSNDVLERMAEELKRLNVGQPIRVAYGRVALVDNNGVTLNLIGKQWTAAKKHLFDYMPIPHPGLLHHKSIFELRGKFDESFRIAADYELLLRELKNNDAHYFNDLITVGMQYGGFSSDLNKLPKILLEEARARHKNSLPAISMGWLIRFFRASIRSILARVFSEEWVRKLAILRGRLIGRTSFWEKLS